MKIHCYRKRVPVRNGTLFYDVNKRKTKGQLAYRRLTALAVSILLSEVKNYRYFGRCAQSTDKKTSKNAVKPS